MTSSNVRSRVGSRWIGKIFAFLKSNYSAAVDSVVRYMVGPRLKVILILAFVFTPLAYYFDLTFQPTHDTWGIRVVGSLSIVLPLYTIFTARSERVVAQTSMFAATVLLMWMFPAMLFVNMASTPEGVAPNSAWLTMYLLSIFLYVQFINHFFIAICGWAVGLVAAMASVVLIDSVNVGSIFVAGYFKISTVFTAVLFSGLINKQVENVERDKTDSARALGGNIAHELRTPLSGINSRAKALEKLLPELTEGYNLAVSEGLLKNPIPEKQVKLLKSSLADIQAEAKYSNAVINMLLVNTSEKPMVDIQSDTFGASAVIGDALHRYPFPNEKEREMVKISGHHCSELIFAPKLLVEHILFNLIKNALFHCQKAEKGSVSLSAESTTESVNLVVRDSGPGIDPAVLPKIFDRFFTTTTLGQGSGIGLNFCKQVMVDLGGSIECTSRVGDLTEFVVAFPREGKKQNE